MSESTQGKKRATLREVAEEAGVSLKTASNVINHSGRMSDVTREKVQNVIDKLGYRVNVAARNLNRGHTGFITLAVPGLTAPYLAQLANKVIDAARAQGYSVYVTTYAEDPAAGVRRLLTNFNTTVSDGMILSISEADDLTADDLDVEYPLVCLGARSTYGRADHVTTDDVQAARQAAGFLIDHGSSKLAVIGARNGSKDPALALEATEGNAQLRLRGVLEECAERGLSLDPHLIGDTGNDWSIGSGARMAQHLIDTGIPFDGIVAFNDQLAMGALFTLASNGIAVPGGVQVIGFDNIDEAAYFQPPLTTMDSMIDWIAPTSVERILERIGSDKPIQPKDIVRATRVIRRATTRA